ncbi:HAMP domain-containing protein [Reyranella aquatilis]|uniref:histidine kinase n=1 Tax=Reyranella aquatilis TaxID=2035356 RepID=A0ABS8L2A1_9HYPH|nr:ATP-binding protein [Reyranella aquatilis]MCC8432454.1 HAMP domain-containing protein [Reyranella aquatilis]
MKWPRPFGAMGRLATQLVAVLVVSSLIAWIGISSIFVVLSPESLLFLSPTATRHVVSLFNALHGLEAVPAADRPRLLFAFQRPDFSANLTDAAPSLPSNQLETEKEFRSWFLSQLPPGVDLLGVFFEGRDGTVVARLSDGQLVVFRVVRDIPHFLSLPIVLVIAFMVLSIVLLSLWAVLRLAAPLSRFAAAVDRFGADGDDESVLREEGPEEIRRAARAFNRMQQRILRLIEDRTRMLMAISHDLRTPLTRLRLRLEDVSDPKHRQRMQDDIALMDGSIASAIAYVREGGTREAPEMADLPSLLETVCSHFEDAGHPISYEGPRHLTVQCLPLALERGISNLVDNAVKYGTSVTVRLDASQADRVSIDVEDDGPGIPDAEKARVVEPFYRADEARHRVGGFGLGLAITATVARHHGGTLTLQDRAPRGLLARLTIPSPLPQ